MGVRVRETSPLQGVDDEHNRFGSNTLENRDECHLSMSEQTYLVDP